MTGPIEDLLSSGKGWWNRAVDLLLPARCVLCEMPSDSDCICSPCKADLPWTGHHCPRCALPLSTAGDDFCGQCIQHPTPFTRTLSPLQYGFPADRLVQSLKYGRQLVAGKILGRLLSDCIADSGVDYPDVIMPVPLHKLRVFKRGFNQSSELGYHVSKTLGVPLNTASLRRRRNTKSQSGLSRKQRRKNVRGAFYWHPPVKAPHHVALIDDVMTTGTTVSECARVLKKAGARQVDVWVATRAIPSGRH